MSNDARPPAEGWTPAVTRLTSYGPYHRPEPIPLHWKAVTVEWHGPVPRVKAISIRDTY